jgi:hypothetical protein
MDSGLGAASVYLHYVFDLWVQHWRKHHARSFGDEVSGAG